MDCVDTTLWVSLPGVHFVHKVHLVHRFEWRRDLKCRFQDDGTDGSPGAGLRWSPKEPYPGRSLSSRAFPISDW